MPTLEDYAMLVENTATPNLISTSKFIANQIQKQLEKVQGSLNDNFGLMMFNDQHCPDAEVSCVKLLITQKLFLKALDEHLRKGGFSDSIDFMFGEFKKECFHEIDELMFPDDGRIPTLLNFSTMEIKEKEEAVRLTTNVIKDKYGLMEMMRDSCKATQAELEARLNK